jgi:Predicted transcriptional regulator
MSECTKVASQNAEAETPAAIQPGRLIRLPEVMARVGMKRSAIYERMRDGRFPRSRSLGSRCAVWVEAEIDEWMIDIVRR